MISEEKREQAKKVIVLCGATATVGFLSALTSPDSLGVALGAIATLVGTIDGALLGISYIYNRKSERISKLFER